ncbi:MAG TPA: methionyl-tRNA formyltransferase [Acidimicrobiia bacterium]|nr:methionyl-tRNA formyltransferase [Acidimicrobiia bacterium]
MRLVYFGTPAASVPPLRALVAAGHEIAFVVTQPDRRRGRGSAAAPSPVKEAATELGIPVLTPRRSREVVDDVAGSGAELGVVVAFGQLLPVALLDALPRGFVNVHFSLLPRWRGAAPVERAVLAGDTETGVTIMRLDEGLDTGPVYARAIAPIGPDDTAGDVTAALVELGADLLVATLPEIVTRAPEPQQGEPTYADKLTVEEFELDLQHPADALVRVVRAGNPRPGAWTTVNGSRVKVWTARVDADGTFEPLEVQPEGKGRMPADAWARGLREPPVWGT